MRSLLCLQPVDQNSRLSVSTSGTPVSSCFQVWRRLALSTHHKSMYSFRLRRVSGGGAGK